MKIAAVGSGELGSAFAALLCEAKQDVFLLTSRENRAIELNSSGLTTEQGGLTRVVPVRASSNTVQLRERIVAFGGPVGWGQLA